MGDAGRKLLVDVRARAAAWRVTDDALAQLSAEEAAGWTVYVARGSTNSDGDGGAPPSDEVVREISDAEVYFGFGISPALFGTARRLRWVHSASVGVGSVLFDELVSGDVLLTNSAGVYASAIADHAIGGILYFMRSLDVAAEGQRNRRWLKDELAGETSTMREVAGSRVVIVGTGGIGSEIAARLRAMGADCVGIRRRPVLGAPPGFTRVTGLASLDVELPHADVLVLASAATGETEGLLSRERIALLAKGAIVVNVARGSLLDEEALAEALSAGRIRGAFLDVFRREPPGSDSPLWNQPGLFLSPHVSGVSPARFWEREMALFLDNWRRYRAGQPLRNLVDKQAGY